MKNKTKALIATITLILMMPFLIVPASALTIPNYYWPGSPTSDGVLLEGENIILEKQAVRFEGQRSRSSNLLSSPSVHLLPWDPRGFEGTGPRPPTCWGLFLAPARTSPTALRAEGLWSRPPLPAR